MQNYNNIEYIIVDGESTDSTVNKISNYKNKISKFVSEPDNGIYDAMNKGISLSTGDIIGFVHSDDILVSENTIRDIVHCFGEKIDSVYGNINYISGSDGKIIRRWKAGDYIKNKFKQGWMPPHPALYIKKDIYLKYGFFRTDFGSAADYELILRFFYLNNISCRYIQRVVVNMRVGGLSNRSFYNRLVAHWFDWKAWRVNGIARYPVWVFLKPLRKIRQFFG